MKKASTIKLLPLVATLILCTNVLPGRAGIHYIRHFDYSKPTSDQNHYVPLPMKTQRVSSSKGEIKLNFYDDMPDSIKTAVIVAKELWETKLHNKKPVYIDVTFEPLEDGTVISTETGMWENNGKFYPSALGSQWRDQRDEYNEGPDGYISLNSDMNWNCSFSKKSTSSYNVTTMMLRGIARCLGFISSVKQYSEEKYYFYDMVPSVFDCHLYNGSSCMADIKSYSPELSEFLISDNVHFATGQNNYPIYAPKEFQEGESLCYLDKKNSLMSHSLGEGNAFLNIDDVTIDILNSVGWDLPTETLRIKCSDIDETGIGSCYKSHVFSLAENSLDISKYSWTFSLKKKDDKYEVISKGDTKNFTINKVSEPNKYYANANGDLEGKVECVYYVDGIEYSAEPYHVSLEQKPLILSVSNMVRTWDKFNFDLNFNVTYTGAERIFVEIEEEYDYNIRSYRIDEPFIAHVKTGQISGLYYSWLTIKVSNNYGTVRETLEFPPFFEDDKTMTETTAVRFLHDGEEDTDIQIFDLQGHLLFEGTASNFHDGSLSPGVYIKKTIFHSGESLISKILIK